ncbi:MAG: hypothetical protein AAGD38_04555 [Acidobacteriota bacterium]
MTSAEWKIPKKLKQVVMWVHPEGRVVGALFVQIDSYDRAEEQPLEILNDGRPFVVVQRRNPSEIRFYNKASIVRVEYQESAAPTTAERVSALACRLHLMDGSLLEGTVMKSLPPDRSRLFDFLNLEDERFIKLYPVDEADNSIVTLVNKSFISFVSTPDRD